MSEIKEKHFVEISRKDDQDNYYRWGTYDLHESNEVLALIQSAWEFGLHQQNYGIAFVEAEKKTTDEEKMPGQIVLGGVDA